MSDYRSVEQGGLQGGQQGKRRSLIDLGAFLRRALTVPLGHGSSSIVDLWTVVMLVLVWMLVMVVVGWWGAWWRVAVGVVAGWWHCGVVAWRHGEPVSLRRSQLSVIMRECQRIQGRDDSELTIFEPRCVHHTCGVDVASVVALDRRLVCVCLLIIPHAHRGALALWQHICTGGAGGHQDDAERARKRPHG